MDLLLHCDFVAFVFLLFTWRQSLASIYGVNLPGYLEMCTLTTVMKCSPQINMD